MSEPKIAIVHDRLTVPGGGERVVHVMSEVFESDVITGKYAPDSTYDFSHTNVREIGGARFSSFIRLRDLVDWEDYDVVVFSGNRPQFTLWRDLPVPTIRYCHSPVRTFWSLRDRDFQSASIPMKIVRMLSASTYRNIDRKLAEKHDSIVTNSHNIRSQVDRFYGIEADVLYPPIDTTKYEFRQSGSFWLSVNRLAPKNRVIEQIEAFEGESQKLIIVGGDDELFPKYSRKVRRMAKGVDNIELQGFAPEERLKELYSKCKGVIYVPYLEDFGIVPIEAMASGKPVLATAEGGPLETITHKKTGWLVKPSKDEIQKAINDDFDPDVMRENCMSSASRFDANIFIDEFSAHVNNLVSHQ